MVDHQLMKSPGAARLSVRGKILLGAAAAAQVAAIGAAHADISRRDPSRLNGAKAKWRAISLISAIGPLWYYLRGRR